MDSQEQRAPLQGRYWPTVAFVLLALVPDLVLSTAMPMLQQSLVVDLHTTVSAISLGDTFSNAGWAFGAVLASFLALRFSSYRLNLIYEGTFVVGSLLGLVAPTAPFLIAGRILQGTSTGMLLVSTLPPLIRNFPKERLSMTVAIVDVGFFGVVTAGPLVGGYVATTGTWRWLFGATLLMGLGALVLAYLVVPRDPGYNPDFPFDFRAIGLAAAASGLTFYGVCKITQFGWMSPQVWIPTALGIGSMVALIVDQYRRENALIPVRELASTYPLMGITAGIVGGLAFTALTEVIVLVLEHVNGYDPLRAGLIFWPALLTSLVAAVVFGLLFATRYILLLPAMGLLSLIVGAWLLATSTTADGTGRYLWVTGLLGFGAGITVSPGLFMAGLSVKPSLVGRAFALVELLRLAGAFAFVPAFTYFVTISGMRPQSLVMDAHFIYLVILVVLVVTAVVVTGIFVMGGARIHAPDLAAYVEQNQPALESPRVTGTADRPRAHETLGAAVRSIFAPLRLRRKHEHDPRESERQRDSRHPARS